MGIPGRVAHKGLRGQFAIARTWKGGRLREWTREKRHKPQTSVTLWSTPVSACCHYTMGEAHLIATLPGQDAALHGRAVGDGLVGVDPLAGLLAVEVLFDQLLHLGDARAAPHQHDLVNLLLLQLRVLQCLWLRNLSAPFALWVVVTELCFKLSSVPSISWSRRTIVGSWAALEQDVRLHLAVWQRSWGVKGSIHQIAGDPGTGKCPFRTTTAWRDYQQFDDAALSTSSLLRHTPKMQETLPSG